MPRTKILSKTFFAMGTANTITIPEKYADVAEDIRSFIMTLHDLVNVFDDRSELSEINRMAGRQEVTVNPNTFRLLVHAERARLKTGGSFHAVLLPAIQIWRKAKETQRLPSHFELRKTSHFIKKSELILNPDPTCFAMYIYGPAEIQEGFRYISLSQHFYCTVDGISFGDSAEIDSLSCFFQENRMLFGIQN